MTVLVTGGAGYIGSHTVLELASVGTDVVIADDLSRSDARVLETMAKIAGRPVEFARIDVTDERALSALFASHRFEAVVHFAARKSVAESHDEPLAYYRTNLGALFSLLACMRRHDVSSLVFSSSAAVYGDVDGLTTSPYARTKRMGEDVLADVVRASGLRAVALRYFNPCGAHESAQLGELPDRGTTNLMPAVARAAVEGGPLRVFGTDYETPDGTAMRDYVHVVDVARAHLAALARVRASASSTFETFDLGTGISRTVLDVIRAFEARIGRPIAHSLEPRRAGDVPRLVANGERARLLLGWGASLDLDAMVDSSLRWHEHWRDHWR